MMGMLDLKSVSPTQREKLRDRVRTRDITVADLQQFDAWAHLERDYPVGKWCKDFGSFKAVGKGFGLSTFLTKEQPCYGQRLAAVVADWLAGHIPF